MAQPAQPQVLHGSVSVVQNGAQTVVTTRNGIGSNHSAINWQSFGVPSGTGTWFNQPAATSTSINRVTGPDPSLILGRLGSNGRLVLVNPAGIAVGAGAAVDTAGFTASTLALSPVDAIAGRLRFGSDGAKAGGTLSVQGQIVARHGDIVLIAPQIETGASATIESSGGDTILAAGRKVELTGRGLEGIRLLIQAPDDSAVNLGRLKGDSVGVFASQLRHSGAIQASSASGVGGRVVLSGRSLAEIDGRITAVAGDKGGSVHVSAERLVLKSTTSIDVSGRVQGGELLVGGGWQGRDSRVANARTVDVEPGVQLRADATLSGHGGTVVVWSDERTAFAGSLSARGAGSGDGGNAEVSGKQQLRFRGRADLGSPTGKTGVLLLDPETVTIQGGNGASTDSATIFQSDIEANVANTVIQASQQIQVAGPFTNGELTVQGGGIRFEVTPGAPGGIDLRGMPITSQGGNVDLVTASAGQDIYPDRITTSGAGAIAINAANARVTLSNVSLSTSSGNVTIHGNPTSGPGVLLAGTSIRTGGSRGDDDDNRKINISSPAGIDVRDTTFIGGSRVNLSAPGSTVAFSGANQLFQDVQVNAQSVTNSGDFRINGPASLEVENSGFQNSGTVTLLNGAKLEAASMINQAGGVIAGVGQIELDEGGLQNYGTLQPGGVGTVGRLQIEGKLLNGSGAETVMDVAGSTVYDTIDVEGELQHGGTLKVVSLAYSPAPADRYTLFTSESARGRFGAIAAPSFPGFDAVYGARTTDFQTVAQPPAPAPVASAPPDSAPAPAPAAAPTATPAAAPAPAPAAASPAPAPASAPAPVPASSPDAAPAPAVADAPVPTPSPEAGPAAAPVPTPVAVPGPAPAAAPTSAPEVAPATTAPATAGNSNPAAPMPGPAPTIAGAAPSIPGLKNDPVVVAAVRQQTSQLDAFVARAPVPISLAASPRSKDDDDVAVTAVQCVPGSSAPSRLPLAVIRPAFDWWR